MNFRLNGPPPPPNNHHNQWPTPPPNPNSRPAKTRNWKLLRLRNPPPALRRPANNHLPHGAAAHRSQWQAQRERGGGAYGPTVLAGNYGDTEVSAMPALLGSLRGVGSGGENGRLVFRGSRMGGRLSLGQFYDAQGAD
jgi:hypothetical protein